MKAKLMLGGLLVPFAFLVGCGSLTPRSGFLLGMNYSEQAPKTLIRLECNGTTSVKEGVAVCEEKTPREAKIDVKIMPVPGRVVYSDGLNKKVEDFNYLTSGKWIWKKQIINQTWVPLDIGELNSIYGDVPITFAVQGETSVGIINTRGVLYHRVCNDRDVPCSKLIVKYDCSGKIGNTYPGQIGACSRMAGSSQDFEIPLKPNNLQKGARIHVISGLSNWTFSHHVSEKDVELGYVKFQYPQVQIGPDLFGVFTYQWEQGILQRYQTSILIHGFSPEWTGIDRPHHHEGEWCMPFTSDLMEIYDSKNISSLSKGCMSWKQTGIQTCAFAMDRESGDMTYNCVKNGKEERFP